LRPASTELLLLNARRERSLVIKGFPTVADQRFTDANVSSDIKARKELLRASFNREQLVISTKSSSTSIHEFSFDDAMVPIEGLP